MVYVNYCRRESGNPPFLIDFEERSSSNSSSRSSNNNNNNNENIQLNKRSPIDPIALKSLALVGHFYSIAIDVNV